MADGEEQVEPAVDGGSPTPADSSSRSRWIAVAATVLTIVPIVVAVVRALADGWIPTGDDSFIALRAHDVLGDGPLPLLGTWTSASQWSGIDMNMPGPAMFDALAVPVWLFGPFRGTAIGTGLVNAAAVAVCAGFAWRMGRLPFVLVTNVFVASLLWSVGDSILVDPWNPNMATLPFLALLFTSAAAWSGDPWALPFGAAATTFVVQAHLSFVLLAPAVFLVGAVGLAVTRVLDRREPESPPRSPASNRGVSIAVAVTLLIVAVGWAQPIYEEITGDPGNATRLYRASQVDPPYTPSLGESIGGTSLVLARPPLWLGSSWNDLPLSALDLAPPASTSAPLVAALLAALGWVAVTAHRRRDGPTTGLAVTAGVAVVLSIISATRSTSPYGLRPEYLRYLWPIALVAWLAIAWGLARTPAVRASARRVVAPVRGSLRGRAVAAGFVALALVVALCIPRSDNVSGAPEWAQEPSRDFITAARDAIGGERGVVIQIGYGPAASAIGPPLMAALADDGYEIRTEETVIAFQIGHSRRFRADRDGDLPKLLLVHAASDEIDGRATRELASTPGLDDADSARRDALLARFATAVERDGGLTWDPEMSPRGGERGALSDLADDDPAAVMLDLRLLRTERPNLRPPSGMTDADLDELLVLSATKFQRQLRLYLVEP